MSEIDRDVLQFVADKFRDQAIGKVDDDKREEAEEEFYSLIADEDFKGLHEYAEKLEEEHDLDLSAIKNFTETVQKDDLIEATETEESSAELSDGLAQAIKMQVQQKDEEEMIVRTEEDVRIADLFTIQEQLYRDHGKKAFIISDQKKLQGRVSVEISSTKEKIQLLQVYKGDDNYEFRHLGQSASQYKGMKVEDQHNHGFFIYKFLSNNTEYLLFSTEKLDPMTCDVRGMHLKLSDFKQIGDNTGLPVDRDIIFAHSVEPAIKKLSDEEVGEIEPDVDHEWLAERLLGDWRHPEWFEKLLITMNMVNEEHGYPSGMLWMAETGTGKSKVLKSMAEAFDEKAGVHTGSASTVKGLTPSFADTPPKEGFLLKTTRIAAVDEIFNLLSSAVNGEGNKKDAFRPLLDLVEHQDRTFSSGNGSIRGKMEGIMIGAGNDSYGVESISQAADKLDEAFLGRFLLYEQTESHVQFIEDRKYEIQEQSAEYPDGDPDFISLIDHLRDEVEVPVERGKVKEIKDRLENRVPSNFDAIYRARYDHHIKNLVSGHSKYRSLTSGTLDFEAKEEDYEFAEKIVRILVNSWISNADLQDMALEARPYYLKKDRRQVFEKIRHDHPMELEGLEEEFDEAVGMLVDELQRLDLVEEVNDRYYPYFADQTLGNKKFEHINNSEET